MSDISDDIKREARAQTASVSHNRALRLSAFHILLCCRAGPCETVAAGRDAIATLFTRPGRPAKMIVAKIRSMMPLASIQPHRPGQLALVLDANMIEATPSITKNTMRIKVSERTALRDERPPETRRLAHPEGGDQTDDSADEKEPAIQDLDCERGDLRNSDCGQTAISGAVRPPGSASYG